MLNKNFLKRLAPCEGRLGRGLLRPVFVFTPASSGVLSSQLSSLEKSSGVKRREPKQGPFPPISQLLMGERGETQRGTFNIISVPGSHSCLSLSLLPLLSLPPSFSLTFDASGRGEKKKKKDRAVSQT